MEEIRDVQRVTLRPTDVVVVRLERELSADGERRLREHVQRTFPENPVLVLGPEADLEIYEWESPATLEVTDA